MVSEISRSICVALCSFVLLFSSLGAHQVHGFASPDLFEKHDIPTRSDSLIAERDVLLAPRASTSASSGQGDYTCGPGKPCSNGACCGVSGWCGYSPTYCGSGCQSNCNAKAECGQFAATAGQSCPLNVCCSEFGFCGTTSDFCGTGCQSNCNQPKPSGPSTNSQQRIIGYWEGWNSQHACGQMSIGEIPVNMLTHLNVAFGYINNAFQVTNMDGLSTDIYRDVGNVKSRNPNIKLIIALGGWSFSDPGPWQSVFPTLVSSQANRATFIQNLLGFLSEYGYDGVDFDWEYPGADDRGGSAQDGVNYTSLLKELRAAIQASGRNYIITFTAPTSFWYLRHFDLKNMVQYVDWINLMAYDLHGVWDSSNPIGNRVLAHTNLTEIDLALDLFWRVGVEPSSIVLGLGFYGRSFTLDDASCWKPGCTFSGPGAAGPCTGAAGILSYREITQILQTTGATAYLDEQAAARYLVYNDNSWISFDDAGTFQQKIEYANKIGLSGLMVWAVDLDDSNLDALRAISGGAMPGSQNPFDLVDLKYLFPTEILPPADAQKSYGLVNFGALADSGEMDPGSTGFGFMLIAGDTYAVTNLRKREGLPDPFVFLDCPADMHNDPHDKIQKARVVCLSDDVAGCYRVKERGVEGTIVEMPDNCAGNQFARAVSLVEAKDQTLPPHVANQKRGAKVYEFSFDFNFDLVRRDTNNTSIRVDYSNIRGYWNTLVDSPGIQSRDLGNQLDPRYFAPTHVDWNSAYDKSGALDFNPADGATISQDMSAPLFWQATEQCRVDGNDFDEGFGAYVQGRVDAKYFFGFSMVATANGGFDVKQANGIIKATGQTDLTYAIGGVGQIDINHANKGNPAFNEGNKISLAGHTITSNDGRSLISINPYYSITYQMATFNSTGPDASQMNSIAPFDGFMSNRVITDLGNFSATFPSLNAGTVGSQSNNRKKNQIQIGGNDVLYSTSGKGGSIAIGTYVKFGLSVDMTLFTRVFPLHYALPDMSLLYNTMSVFSFFPGAENDKTTVCTNYSTITNVFQFVENNEIVGWSEQEAMPDLATDSQSPSGLCYPNKPSQKRRSVESVEQLDPLYDSKGLQLNTSLSAEKAPRIGAGMIESLESRQSGGFPGWGYLPNTGVLPGTYLPNIDSLFNAQNAKFDCQDCISCGDEDTDRPGRCCGCVSMDKKWVYSDIPLTDAFIPDDGTWPGGFSLKKREEEQISNTTVIYDDNEEEEGAEFHQLDRRLYGTATMSPKKVSFCGQKLWLNGQYLYPAFPAVASYPWEGIDNGMWNSISRYWGNSSDFCSNWGIINRLQADTTRLSGGLRVRAKYQTEHVFEGQLIGDFFTWWLDKGEINKQNPPPANPTSKLPCFFVQQFIMTENPNYGWNLNGQTTSFAKLLLSELGSQTHLDRLTIYQARPNQKKGAMFTGSQPTSTTSYAAMGQDEQLQAVKEMGLVFSYLNDQQVFDAFCGTYEAIYNRMADFNTWWAANGSGVTIPNLQDEWQAYVRVVLSSLVNRSLATFDYMYANRKAGFFGLSLLDAPYSGHWFANRFINRQQIRISRTCPNL